MYMYMYMYMYVCVYIYIYIYRRLGGQIQDQRRSDVNVWQNVPGGARPKQAEQG